MEQSMNMPWMRNGESGYNEWQYRGDINYIKSLYQPMTLEILSHVEDACDQLEYDGSFMFDEYPDQQRIIDLVAQIHEKLKHMENMYAPVLEESENLNIQGHCVSCRGQESWLENLITVLLLNEMLYRRRRYFTRRGRR